MIFFSSLFYFCLNLKFSDYDNYSNKLLLRLILNIELSILLLWLTLNTELSILDCGNCSLAYQALVWHHWPTWSLGVRRNLALQTLSQQARKQLFPPLFCFFREYYMWVCGWWKWWEAGCCVQLGTATLIFIVSLKKNLVERIPCNC